MVFQVWKSQNRNKRKGFVLSFGQKLAKTCEREQTKLFQNLHISFWNFDVIFQISFRRRRRLSAQFIPHLTWIYSVVTDDTISQNLRRS